MNSQLKNLCLAAGFPCEEEITTFACFQIDDKLTLMMIYDEAKDLLLIECDIIVVLPEDREEASRLIATANFRFLQTDGSTLGISSSSGNVLLCRNVPFSSLDEINFQILITRLLDVAERWHGRLEILPKQRALAVNTSSSDHEKFFGDFPLSSLSKRN